MKTTMLKVVIAVSLFLFFSVQSWSDESKPRHAPDALPGVEPQMLTPGYWIALQPDADEVIMIPYEIERFNEKVRNKKVVFRARFGKTDPLEKDFARAEVKGLIMNPLLPLDLPDTLPGDRLRDMLRRNIEWLYSRDFYDGRNAIYNESMRQEIVDKMNVNGIPDVITRRFGIIVNHANVRFYPTSVPGYSDTKWELDFFQATGICLGNPVTVLHQSVDGDFFYVESPIARGWISVKDIALADRESIRKLTEEKNFLMATGDKIPVYGDSSFRNFARYFYFSATMPLIRHDRTAYSVKMPFRKPDGSLGISNGYVKPDADVNIGYLPYTKRNVITQFFKLLNKPYGWGDQDNKRSCAGTQRVLIACFGIKTGRHPSFLLSASDHQTYINPGLSTEDKTKEVSKIEPIVTLAGTPGHIVLYLGKAHNGKLYFMHQAGWGYEDENGDHLIVNRTTVNSVEHKWYDISRPRVFTTFRK